VDKKLAPVIAEVLLTVENSGRVVPLLVPVLAGIHSIVDLFVNCLLYQILMHGAHLLCFIKF
jgi:hypothetical protein